MERRVEQFFLLGDADLSRCPEGRKIGRSQGMPIRIVGGSELDPALGKVAPTDDGEGGTSDARSSTERRG